MSNLIVDAHAHPLTACVHEFGHSADYAEMSKVFLGPYEARPAELVALMDENGVDLALALGAMQKSPEEQLAAIDVAPDRFLGFFAPQGNDPEDAARQTREALGSGRFVGVGEIYLYSFGGESWPEMFEGLRPVLDVADEFGVPVTFHTGNAPYPFHRLVYNDPMYIDEIARAYPKLPLIIGHMGCSGSSIFLSFADHALMVAAKNPNVYLDTSTAPPRVIEAAILEPSIGPSKLMFATDFPAPVTFYSAQGVTRGSYRKRPEPEYVPSHAQGLQWIRSMGLARADLDAVLGGTVLRLLGR